MSLAATLLETVIATIGRHTAVLDTLSQEAYDALVVDLEGELGKELVLAEAGLGLDARGPGPRRGGQNVLHAQAVEEEGKEEGRTMLVLRGKARLYGHKAADTGHGGC